jgi:streptomycin 3"-adenylyltransferase
MSQYGWADCPEAIRHQIETLLADLRSQLGDALIGLYLHGSLVMGCFNPAHSDIDLIAVLRVGLEVEDKRRLAESLLRHSNMPRPVEISFLAQNDLAPWRHPTPYTFHYSEAWRERYTNALISGAWRSWPAQPDLDSDLAAHLTVTRQRGLCLYGAPIEQVIPPVPAKDYAASIVGDLWWARDRYTQEPSENGPYLVLNACRVYAFLLEGAVLSKDEGGAWALTKLPDTLTGLVRQALDIYRGECGSMSIDQDALRQFMIYIEARVQELQR